MAARGSAEESFQVFRARRFADDVQDRLELLGVVKGLKSWQHVSRRGAEFDLQS